MSSGKAFPHVLFIDREDCELLWENPRIGMNVLAEYSPESQFITKTETYFHRSKIVEMQNSIAEKDAEIQRLKKYERIGAWLYYRTTSFGDDIRIRLDEEKNVKEFKKSLSELEQLLAIKDHGRLSDVGVIALREALAGGKDG